MVVEARRVCTSRHCNVFCKYERLSVNSSFDMFSIFVGVVIDCWLKYVRGVLF